MLTPYCPVCQSTKSYLWMKADKIYNLRKCVRCGCGFQDKILKVSEDYSDYGAYIANKDNAYFQSRTVISLPKRIFFRILKKIHSKNIKILDFGGGAGFFVRSCIDFGFNNTYLYEPSDLFKKVARNKLGIDEKKILQHLDQNETKFDLITMLDVIEHLPILEANKIFKDLEQNLERGSLLFGMTPNADSFNILLHRNKDPAIAPPSHTIYFTKKSLNKFLEKHNFKKIISFSMGLSTNSFFRKSKFMPSWVENPNKSQRIWSNLIKLVFFLGAFPVSILGKGYHIVFVYKYLP